MCLFRNTYYDFLLLLDRLQLYTKRLGNSLSVYFRGSWWPLCKFLQFNTILRIDLDS